jgi:hypothetical protein
MNYNKNLSKKNNEISAFGLNFNADLPTLKSILYAKIFGYKIDNNRIITNFLKYKIGINMDKIAAFDPLWEFIKNLANCDFPECPYHIDVKNQKVLDIGGFIGETALFFYNFGAKHVKIIEPVYYEYIRENLILNNLPIDILPYGIGYNKRECAKEALNSTGLERGNLCFELVEPETIIDDYDLIKLDCEGCELSLLKTDCKILKKANRYDMEIHHGFENVIKLIEKFKQCNMNPYKVVKIVPNGELSYLYVIN